MKRFFSFIGYLLLLFSSCSKKNDLGSTIIEYQMTSVERQDLLVLMTYNNESGTPISGTYLSGWKQQIVVKNKPFTAYVRANYPSICSGCYLNVSLKILVNGTVVKEQTGMIRRMNTTDDVSVNVQYTVN